MWCISSTAQMGIAGIMCISTVRYSRMLRQNRSDCLPFYSFQGAASSSPPSSRRPLAVVVGSSVLR